MWMRRIVSHFLWTQDVQVSKGYLAKMGVLVEKLSQDPLGQFLNGMMSMFWKGICLIMWALETYLASMTFSSEMTVFPSLSHYCSTDSPI